MQPESAYDQSWYDENKLTTRRWDDYGLDLADLADYGLHDITAGQAAELGFHNPSDGIYISYPDDADSRIRYYRTGFQAQTEGGKYGQRRGTMPAAYWAPRVEYSTWATKPEIPILITEGEFKAIVVDNIANSVGHTTVVAIGLGGVFNWQSKKLGVDLLPKLKDVKWMGRRVYIAFDMDMQTNPFVALALQRLFNKLAGLGAVCGVLTWDGTKGKGIDDFLCQCPSRRAAWLELLATAQQPVHVIAAAELNKRFVYVEREQKIWDMQNVCYVTVKSFSQEFFTEKCKIQTSVKQTANGPVPVMKELSMGAYWLQSSIRSAVVGLQFVPGGKPIVEQPMPFGDGMLKYLNTWRGWGVGLTGRALKPVKGDVEPFKRFIKAAFGNEDQAHCEYLEKRLAWIFQQPTVKHPTWIYIIGRPYQGKSTLLKLIAELVGQTCTSNIDERALQSQFAEWRAEKLLVTLDDSSVKDRHLVQQLLKRLTTEEHSQVNKKYQSEYTASNYTTFFFAANGVDALLEHDDRRALVLSAECSWDYAKGEWKEFDDWRRSVDGKQALLHYLMYEVKLEAGFLEETPPRTQARELVIESGASSWDSFLMHVSTTVNGLTWRGPASGELRTWTPTVISADMLKALYGLMNNGHEDKYEIKLAALGMKFARYGARKCMPTDSLDARGRLFIAEHQVQLWTWDKRWISRTREEYIDEFMQIIKRYPELGPAKKGKF